ncbi:MAG: hypothetical protein ACRD9L_06505 [Bryobacteraceae bacterium]
MSLFAGLAAAQPISDAAPVVPATDAQSADASSQDPQDRRIFGVLPNYRTADGSVPFQRISTKYKFTIALKDSLDYPVYPFSAAFALLYQMEDSNPSFGQGLKGYSRRFAASYADQAISDLMAEAVMPTVFHQDPRYFRIGSGSTFHRTFYALTRVVVARNDAGKWTFNYGEWAGNSVAVAISNAYYPDSRDFDDNVSKLCIQVATDAFSNVLKEFWPDIRNKLHRHKDAALLDRPWIAPHSSPERVW